MAGGEERGKELQLEVGEDVRKRRGSETYLDVAEVIRAMDARRSGWVNIPGKPVDEEYRRAQDERRLLDLSSNVLGFLKQCPEGVPVALLISACESYMAEIKESSRLADEAFAAKRKSQAPIG